MKMMGDVINFVTWLGYRWQTKSCFQEASCDLANDRFNSVQLSKGGPTERFNCIPCQVVEKKRINFSAIFLGLVLKIRDLFANAWKSLISHFKKSIVCKTQREPSFLLMVVVVRGGGLNLPPNFPKGGRGLDRISIFRGGLQEKSDNFFQGGIAVFTIWKSEIFNDKKNFMNKIVFLSKQFKLTIFN